MLGDRAGSKSTRQVAAPGPRRGDVASKGRNWPVILQNLFNFAAERQVVFQPDAPLASIRLAAA